MNFYIIYHDHVTDAQSELYLKDSSINTHTDCGDVLFILNFLIILLFIWSLPYQNWSDPETLQSEKKKKKKMRDVRCAGNELRRWKNQTWPPSPRKWCHRWSRGWRAPGETQTGRTPGTAQCSSSACRRKASCQNELLRKDLTLDSHCVLKDASAWGNLKFKGPISVQMQ